jgi:hypothetical protein
MSLGNGPEHDHHWRDIVVLPRLLPHFADTSFAPVTTDKS